MTDTEKSILVQVSYKGCIEMRKVSTERITDEEFENEVWKDYQMLVKLIHKAQQTTVQDTIENELTNSEISLLERLIDSSTLDGNNRGIAQLAIDNAHTKQDYDNIKEGLLRNQQSPLKERGIGSAKEIQQQLDKDLANPKK